MRPRMGYTCPACGFKTDVTNCDACDGVVKWDSERRICAHCTSCGRSIYHITCRKCGQKFSV